MDQDPLPAPDLRPHPGVGFGCTDVAAGTRLTRQGIGTQGGTTIRTLTSLALVVAAVLAACSPRLGAEAPLENMPQAVSWRVDTHSTRFAPGLGPDGWNQESVHLPGLPEDLRFEHEASLIEHSDGIASLEGVLSSREDPTHRWRLALDFAGLHPEDEEPAPAAGEPEGPAWRSYTLASGELVGLGRCSGGRIRLLSDFPALRLGEGADGFGSGEGALCALFMKVIAQPESGLALDTTEVPVVLRLRLRPENEARHAWSERSGPGPSVARIDR